MPPIRYIDGHDGSVDPADRGLAYGDGIFETMAVRGRRIRYLPLHMDRLTVSCERLRLPAPDHDELKRRLAADADGHADGTIKLILTRGSGPRGYSPPPQPIPTVITFAGAADAPPATSLAVVTLEQRLGENESLAGIKHLCRLEQVLGRLELDGLDADEGLMLSASGQVVGGTSRNVFAVAGNRLLTPDVKRAGVAGVMRRAVLEGAPAAGFRVEARPLTLAELLEADELFMTNALVGIQSVVRLDDTAFGTCSAADRLRRHLGLDRHE